MEDRTAYRAFARVTALGLILVGCDLGCGSDAQSAGPAAEDTASSQEALRSGELDCDPSGAAGAKLPDPPATDCGATDRAACRVSSALTFRTFSTLQAAINAAPDGDVLTVTGFCAGATIASRIGLTIQGPFPAGGCGFNGPSPSQLRGEVTGLSVQRSTNISVRNLNLVKNTQGDGLAIVNSINPLVSCVCAAFNANDGVRLTGTQSAVLSQSLSEANRTGIESNETNTVIISSNTVTANTGTGIFVRNATSNNVSFNIVTNNGGAGILFTNVTNSIATGNTVRNNGGDRVANLIRCTDSQVFGSNVPATCL